MEKRNTRKDSNAACIRICYPSIAKGQLRRINTQPPAIASLTIEKGGKGDYTGAGDKQCRSFTMAGKHALKQTNMKCINARGIV